MKGKMQFNRTAGGCRPEETSDFQAGRTKLFVERNWYVAVEMLRLSQKN